MPLAKEIARYLGLDLNLTIANDLWMAKFTRHSQASIRDGDVLAPTDLPSG